MAPENPYILAADVGTSSLKTVIYSRQGHLIGTATQRYTYQSSYPGWAEGNAEDWWQSFKVTLADLRQQGVNLAEVEAIAFTGQMHTAVLLDAHGQVLEPTILWLDRRAAAETEELKTRLKLPPYQINSTYTLPKLLWLKRNKPDIIAQVHTLLWPKDYLRYRLTGLPCTDMTEAGGAALLDWSDRSWATDRLELVGLDVSVLPPARQAAAIAGTPRADVAVELGLNPQAKIIVGMGDVAALIGGAPPRPGRVVCSLGSSSMIFMALAEDQYPQDPTHRLYVYPLDPYRLLGGVSSTTGAALVWAYNNLSRQASSDATFETMMTEASTVKPGADGLCFIPYLAGERTPYWLDDIRAGFYGFQLSHTSRHVLKAVMEGVAYSLRHLLAVYLELGVPVQELVLAGGGTKTPGLSQVIADVCQYDVNVYTEEETVTRVLYALCYATLNQVDFNETLVHTFPEPHLIPCNRAYAADYQRGYETYRRFAAFALQEATHGKVIA